jgi:hypothetical protein
VNPLFETACVEAEQLSFAVGVEHLVLACAIHGSLDADPDELRARIVERQRAALAAFGISFDAVRERIGAAGCLPVDPEVKRLMELATRNATAERLLATLCAHSATARRLLDEPR